MVLATLLIRTSDGDGDIQMRIRRIAIYLLSVGIFAGTIACLPSSWRESQPGTDRQAAGHRQPFPVTRASIQGTVKAADTPLADVVVFVSDIAPTANAVQPGQVMLRQKNAQFLPMIQIAAPGSELTITNEDEMIHTVHGSDLDSGAPFFNLAMPTKNQRLVVSLPDAGIVQIRCDAGHHWMQALIFVKVHPYYTMTDGEGHFVIPEVPTGTHALTAWHRTFGRVNVNVNVPAGNREDVSLNFEL